MGFRTNRILSALMPSFVSDCMNPDGPKKYKMHPTSYLDGLRGIACLLVFFCHYTEDNHYHLSRYYWSEEAPKAWLQLPYFRLIFSGRPMVHIFFIISGFALSLKPLRHIHEHENDKAYAALASSIIRRPIRLFGPCIVSTFMILILVQLNLLWLPFETLAEQLYNWLWVMSNQVCWPWSWQKDMLPTYDVHLWTIPIEFAHSMLVFLLLVPLAVMKPNVRLLAIPAVALYCQFCGNWAGFEFVSGIFMAELHLRSTLPKNGLAPMPIGEKDMPTRGPTRRLLRVIFFTVAFSFILYLDGWPNLERDMTPFFVYFHNMTPSKSAADGYGVVQKFWFSWSALFTMWAVGEINWIKAFLNNGFSQYLGRISYAMYIVHGPVLNLMQKRILGRAGEGPVGEPGTEGYSPGVEPSGINGYFGLYTPNQMIASWLAGLIVMSPFVFIAADWFMRYVDIPMVNLARRVERSLMR